MLTQIDFSKAALAQFTDQPVIPKLLPDTISHLQLSLLTGKIPCAKWMPATPALSRLGWQTRHACYQAPMQRPRPLDDGR